MTRLARFLVSVTATSAFFIALVNAPGTTFFISMGILTTAFLYHATEWWC